LTEAKRVGFDDGGKSHEIAAAQDRLLQILAKAALQRILSDRGEIQESTQHKSVKGAGD
jgi:hypothetical protein